MYKALNFFSFWLIPLVKLTENLINFFKKLLEKVLNFFQLQSVQISMYVPQ